MRRVILILLILLLVAAAAISAEPVTRYPYEVKIGEIARSGTYTGDMEDGVPDGFGVFESENEEGYKWHYIGEWKAGLMNGTGAIYWEDGALEIGEYLNGEFESGYFNYDGKVLTWVSGEPVIEEMPKESEAQYIGNRNSGVFHRKDCKYAQKISGKSRIEFSSRQEAEDLEYRPCHFCQP